MKVRIGRSNCRQFLLLASLSKLLLAYIGPGGGLSAIGAFLACIVGIVVAIVGFFWYPIKRLLKKEPQEPDQVDEEEE